MTVQSTTSDVLAILDRVRIVPVVEIVDAAQAVPLARALVAAGLPAIEITLRTPAALDAIAAIAAELPHFALGAGTLLIPTDVTAAVDAGARFLVSPGRTPALSEAALATGLPFVPGAVTPSEMMLAAEAGHRRIKFFPAEQSGGAKALTGLIAPLRALGATFMPTGGIRPDNLPGYLAIPEVFAVGGTWIAPRDVLAAGRFDHVTERARTALATVAQAG